jgi:tRNA A-37 threonylcarbamoyl transferase component Bud32
MTELSPVTKIFKKYRKRGIHNGMTLEQVFDLELEIYNRLGKYDNFPKLISYDKNNFTITIENCGQSLHKLRQNDRSKLVVSDLDEQVNNICQALKIENITYLDLDPHNICCKNNTIFLIDFDKAVVDQRPKSDFLERMYLDFIRNVSEESFKKTLKEFVVNPDWPRYQFILCPV